MVEFAVKKTDSDGIYKLFIPKQIMHKQKSRICLTKARIKLFCVYMCVCVWLKFFLILYSIQYIIWKFTSNHIHINTHICLVLMMFEAIVGRALATHFTWKFSVNIFHLRPRVLIGLRWVRLQLLLLLYTTKYTYLYRKWMPLCACLYVATTFCNCKLQCLSNMFLCL